MSPRSSHDIADGLNDHVGAEEVNLVIRIGDDDLPAVARQPREVAPITLSQTSEGCQMLVVVNRT